MKLGAWRVEADDDWLAAHSSDTFARIRRLYGAGLLNGVSNSVLGGTVIGGTPRRPRLKLDTGHGEQIRYAERQYQYTAVMINYRTCRMCGRRDLVVHRIIMIHSDGQRFRVGTLAKCQRCAADSWLFRSRMPSIVAKRWRDRKVVI